MDARTLSENLLAASRRHADAQQTARTFHDPDLNDPAIQRRRAELSDQARATFAADVASIRREFDALERANHRDRDRVPTPQGSTRDAWERVRMLLDAGRSLREIVDTADAPTLLAIREWGPTYLESLAPAPAVGMTREPVDVTPLERSIAARWAQLKGDRTLAAALADAPALAGLAVSLRHAETVAAGHDHADGLSGAVEAQLAEQHAARTIPAPQLNAQPEGRP